MTKKKLGVYIYANLLDVNKDGKIDMISFISPEGKGIALAVKPVEGEKMGNIHMLQDVTGDGKLDNEDILLIKREAIKIFKNKNLSECQLKLFIKDAEYG